ncbi:hypothetical protein CVT24_011778 [Panaeolus cyanescens]|uniref:F-box domain-containing protein n=1 Tax=Panaeolus cyanescens TaxID=181874 RepID=A0A409VHN6_9AGAR|nr:hypothetical protein CVT24_011778 [Panaeolus cyanescens]
MSQIGAIQHNPGSLSSPATQPGILRKIRSKLKPDIDKLRCHLRQLRVSQANGEPHKPAVSNEPRDGGELSPIHQLPEEIIEEIMLYATNGSVDVCLPASDAWRMEQVCHRWEYVARNLTALWRTIDISLGALALYKTGVPLHVVKKLLERCVLRAGHRPLRLKLMDVCAPETFMAVLRLVSVYSHQWETLYVSLSMLKEPLVLERGLGQLTALEITGKYRGSGTPLEMFANAEAIHSLHLSFSPKPYITLKVPWSNIRQLSISRCDFSPGEFAQLVRHIPNIVSFTSKWSNGIVESGKPSIPQPIVRPRLRRLEIELYQHELGPMLHYFTLPALTHLTVSLAMARKSSLHQMEDPVVQLIRRSYCSLTMLSVNAVDSSSIYDILEVSPNVTELELDLVPDAHLILEYLVQPDILAPDLCVLSLSLKEDQGVRCIGPLITLIQARSLTSGVLKRVMITMRESKGVDPFKKLLYPLREQTGVTICITDYLRI